MYSPRWNAIREVAKCWAHEDFHVTTCVLMTSRNLPVSKHGPWQTITIQKLVHFQYINWLTVWEVIIIFKCLKLRLVWKNLCTVAWLQLSTFSREWNIIFYGIPYFRLVTHSPTWQILDGGYRYTQFIWTSWKTNRRYCAKEVWDCPRCLGLARLRLLHI